MKMATAQTLEPLPERLRRITRPVMIQVAPGVYQKHPEAKAAQDVTIATFVEDQPGLYRLVAVPERMVRLTQQVLELIGMPAQRMTLMRLAKAGMIEMVKVAPNTCVLNMDSWYNHLRRCAENPEMWDPGSPALKEYRRAI